MAISIPRKLRRRLNAAGRVDLRDTSDLCILTP